MSDPPNTSSIVVLDHHHHPLLLSPPPTTTTTTIAPSLPREYRKGNWTLHETLVLITAKKMDEERRSAQSKPSSSSSPSSSATTTSCKTAELRWKWVENYCWSHGCQRSQNQCNDKWDNLLRDYKKVREYEARPPDPKDRPSYWQMEKHERKERNLPSNLLHEVYQALHEVVNRRYSQKIAAPPPPITTAVISRPMPPPSLPPPQPLPPPVPPPPHPISVETTDSSETEGGSDRQDSDTKKRRKVRSLGSSVVRSASVLARALLACEEKKDKRHRDVLELEERKLQMEEHRTEINRQGMAGLITAVNNLSNAIQSLVSDRHDTR
ncbi:trihelix transcription factor DF1-like isoform X2 [Magnolia sinica]|uniref:trihelix transcription factor DF1-like isoform X2 n=1 Tax=Magnolia sinica TaxID=86752 RepID=UPI002659D172|nr:trihelix transcription factor DF1-like isoform X2 [Magnolia sinica]